jgi:hypothetical protein
MIRNESIFDIPELQPEHFGGLHARIFSAIQQTISRGGAAPRPAKADIR